MITKAFNATQQTFRKLETDIQTDRDIERRAHGRTAKDIVQRVRQLGRMFVVEEKQEEEEEDEEEEAEEEEQERCA